MSRTFISVLLFTLFVFCLVNCEETKPAQEPKPEAKAEKGSVFNLTSKNIDETLKNYEYVLVKFFAPWCPHCKTMAPEYEKLAKRIESEKLNDRILIAEVECDTERDLAMKFQVPGFPMIKLFKNAKPYKDFEDERSEAAMFEWLMKRTGPAAFTLEESKDVKEFIEKNNEIGIGAVVGFFSAPQGVKSEQIGNMNEKEFEEQVLKQHKCVAIFQECAEQVDDFMFAQIFDPKVAKEVLGADDQMDTIKLFTASSKTPITLKCSDVKGKIEEKPEEQGKEEPKKRAPMTDVEKWLKEHGYPVIDELNSRSFPRFAESGLPIVILFVNYTNKDEKKKAIEYLTPLAEGHSKKLIFGQTDANVYGEQITIMGGNKDVLPTIAAMNIQKRQNFPYSGKFENKEQLSQWLDELAGGKVKPHLRTEAAVSDEENAKNDVKVVVGSNFEKIVYDETKDVVVMFHAPWCQHCKKMMPQYEKLGKNFANKQKTDKLLIVKINGDGNDVPVVIEGFPTVMMFKRGQKDKPITYEGNRKFKTLKRFVLKNAGSDVQKELNYVEKEEKKPTEKVEEQKPKRDEL